MASELLVCDLGTVDYRSALELQERLRDARRAGTVGDTLLLLEHSPAVYTRGRRSAPGELSFGEAWYAERGIEIIDTNRGGKVTYHGPGQLVGYPIVEVLDVVAYVRLLEQALVQALGEVGVSARARPDEGPDYTGVWVENRKVASIGVHVAHGITTHGFAVNVERRALEPFGWIVACGLPDVEMTSIESELARGGGVGGVGLPVGLGAVSELVSSALAARLGHRTRSITPDALRAILGDAPETLMGASVDTSNLSSR
jgi:lipoyl(octanoyl) transferase